VTYLDKRVKLIAVVFCALLMMSVFGVGTAHASSPSEWTQNSTFSVNGYKWDRIVYDWDWRTGYTKEVDFSSESYVYWVGNGDIRLRACDVNSFDSYGRSARVTYGPFEGVGEYPEETLPIPLKVSTARELTLKGVVSNYGSTNWDYILVKTWTGIKFDAWFHDTANNNRKMVIEMYFLGTGLQGWWGNEHFRFLGEGDSIDDHMIKLQAFPEYCTMTGDIPEENFWSIGNWIWDETAFTIDLKGIWQRAAAHFGRSSDELYAVALDVETCNMVSGIIWAYAFATVNEIRVTYKPTYPTYELTIAAGSGGTTSPAPAIYEYAEGTSATVRALPYSSYTFRYWLLDGAKKYGNPITVTMNSDHVLKAYFKEKYCPILFVWNGTDYDEEGLLNIHDPDGIDIVYNHTLITEPAWTKGKYQLRLVEHQKTHSYIDQVKLYAMLEDGTEIELPLTYAWHSEHGNVLPQLLFSDEWKTDTLGADLNNGTSQSIDLKFPALPPNLQAVSFIFQIEGNNKLPK